MDLIHNLFTNRINRFNLLEFQLSPSAEVSLQQALECLAVSGLILRHFMDGIKVIGIRIIEKLKTSGSSLLHLPY